MKILIINGGGIFGMIPICFLRHVGITDIRKNVDVIAGTSIGGICSLYLSQGLSANQLYSDFKKEAPNIFSKPFWRSFYPFSSKYPSTGINKSLQKMLLGKLKDIKDIKVIIPTLDFRDEKPKIYENISIHDDMDTLIWEIGRATSAAPTYFPPHSNNVFIDGGIIENSPIMTVVTCLKAKMNVQFSDMEVFVLGTGQKQVISRSLRDAEKYSAIDWLRHLLIPFVTKSNEIASNYWAKQLGFKKLTIFDTVTISGEMDDVSQIASGELEKACSKHYSDFAKEWEYFLSQQY